MKANIYETSDGYKLTDLRGNTIFRGTGHKIQTLLKSSEYDEFQVTGIDRPIDYVELCRLFRTGFPPADFGVSVKILERSKVVNGRSVD